MNLHLAEIAKEIAPGAHAALLRRSGGMASLPQARSSRPTSPCPTAGQMPRAQPAVENIWQFMRENWLSNRVFLNPTTTSSITAAKPGTSSDAQPWRIMSIGLRDWAHKF